MKTSCSSTRAALTVAVVCISFGCGSAEDSAPARGAISGSGPDSAATTEELSATQAQEQGILDERFPAQGVRIELEDGRLSVSARHVSRFAVLRRLAGRYRFEIVDWSEDDPLVDVFVENVALETALARLIEPTPYTVAYSHEAETDRNEVVRVVIGSPPLQASGKPDKQARRDLKSAERERARKERRYEPRSEAESQRRMAERAIRQERRKAEALEDLLDEDPTVREDAVATGLDADDPAENALLTDIALNDPDPGVRLEATRQLGFGAASLRSAQGLEDPDPEIVKEVLHNLSYSHDPAVRDLIEEKTRDPNPEISEPAHHALVDFDIENAR